MSIASTKREKTSKLQKTSKRDNFVQTPSHGYFYKQMDKDDNIDKQQTLAWKKEIYNI